MFKVRSESRRINEAVKLGQRPYTATVRQGPATGIRIEAECLSYDPETDFRIN
jgi:hypothetical protein